MASAQDHKRVGEGDTGPNTGGMGAYTGDGLLSAEMEQWLLKNVAQRVVDEMALEGTPFKGILFCGMMMVPPPHGHPDEATQPMVLEFNTRFGDPETQAILVRLETDIVDLFEAAIDGTADKLEIKMRPGASVCVIAASGGYPGKYASGLPIAGLDTVGDPDVVVFHSGTAEKDGAIVTAGGRVLGVTAVSRATVMAPGSASGPGSAGGSALWDALGKAYGALAGMSFEGMQFRGDIGWRALRDGL
jgi:phosphoribosylamine--glycine ligase